MEAPVSVHSCGPEEQERPHEPHNWGLRMAKDGDDAKASSSTPSVFISYASLDGAIAETACEALERAGVTCWIAPRDVTPGAFYGDEIVHAIDAAKAIVLILSQNAATSPHVLREVERAASRRHAVISLRIDKAPLPAGLEYFLNTSQWLDASSGDTVRALPKLVSAVQLAIQAPAMTPADTPRLHATPAVYARSTWRTGIVASVIALGLAVFAADRLWLSGRRSLAPPAQAPAASSPPTVPAVPTIPEKSVAVLPFVDMSAKKDQEYFSDGLSEELIDMLAKVPDLRVPARTSSFYFKGKQATIAEIAKALGVAQVLEGSVRKSGNNLRITAQLIRADNGYHVWSETYDRAANDVFKVQDEIANAVVKALKVALLSAPARRSATATNTEAYTIYLQGRSLIESSGNAARMSTGIEYLERAAKLDPSFAPTWATLSRVYLANFFDHGIGHYPDTRNTAYDAAERAIKLDPDLPEAHVAMGRVYMFDWNWKGAERELGRALELDPANATVARNAHYLSAVLGRFDDAERHAKAAVDLDPLNYTNYLRLGDAEFYAGKLALAEAAYRKTLELRSDAQEVHAALATVLLAQGKPDEALAEVKREPDAANREITLPLILDAIGRTSEADRALTLAETKYGNSFPFAIGELYVSRNDLDRAFAWWDRAYQQHDDGLAALKQAPMVTRSKQLTLDPRYKALLLKMKLPE
jgi:TolB-like protein/Tfp pilus assembly protein PilF